MLRTLLNAISGIYNGCVMLVLNITPLGKPRMTQRDHWRPRACTSRYWVYADKLRLICPPLEWTGISLTFGLPMPESWSKRKKQAFREKPHQSKPDLSNLIKAFEDILLKNDSLVWYYSTMKKVWMDKGCIIINSELK